MGCVPSSDCPTYFNKVGELHQRLKDARALHPNDYNAFVTSTSAIRMGIDEQLMEEGALCSLAFDEEDMEARPSITLMLDLHYFEHMDTFESELGPFDETVNDRLDESLDSMRSNLSSLIETHEGKGDA